MEYLKANAPYPTDAVTMPLLSVAEDIIKQLTELADELAAAKIAESLARDARIDAESRIADLVPTKDTGQKTIMLPDGIKIMVKRGLNYKANIEQIQDYYFDLPEKHSPIKMKTTRELDAVGYEWIRVNDPEAFAIISQHVTVIPKKVAVTIKAK